MTKFKSKENYSKIGRGTRMRKVSRVARHPAVTIPLATFAALMTLTVLALVIFSANTPQLRAKDTRTAIVSHDGQEVTVPTPAANVSELLERLDITLNEGDVVEPGLETEITTDNFRVNVYRAAPVTIVDGDDKTFTFSAAATPRSIVKQVGIEVYPEDRLESIPTDNFLLEGSIGPRVVITRSTPVNINLYGTPVVMRTHAKTVGELLEERDITLESGESARPAVDTPITANMQIFVLQEGAELVMEEQQIEMPVEEVEDKSLSLGTRVVRQAGAPGKRLVTYILEKNETGQETGRKEIQNVVTEEPVKEIVAVGTFVDVPPDRAGVMAAAGISTSQFEYAEYVISRESGWNPGALNSRGCAGLGQACPGSKLAAVCPNWQVDPVCQMRFFDDYATGRYGTWQEAYNFWQVNHWW